MSSNRKIYTTAYALWVAANLHKIDIKPPVNICVPDIKSIVTQLAEVSDSETNAWVNNADFSSAPLHLHRSAGHGIVEDAVFWLSYEEACRDITKARLHALEDAARAMRFLVDRPDSFNASLQSPVKWRAALEALTQAKGATDKLIDYAQQFIERAEEEA